MENKITFLSHEWDSLVVETDEPNPRIIAKIDRNDFDMADGFRIRLKPSENENIRN